MASPHTGCAAWACERDGSRARTGEWSERVAQERAVTGWGTRNPGLPGHEGSAKESNVQMERGTVTTMRQTNTQRSLNPLEQVRRRHRASVVGTGLTEGATGKAQYEALCTGA